MMHTCKDCPLIVMGDFNAEPSGERGIQISSIFTTHDGHILCSGGPTRFGRVSSAEPDYFAVNTAVSSLRLPGTRSSAATALQLSHSAFGSDHVCVSIELALGGSSNLMKRRRKQRFRHPKWRRQLVNRSLVHEHLPAVAASVFQLSVQGQWGSLRELSDKCSFPTPRLKYKDSPQIKQLCQQKRLAVNMRERARLVRVILAAPS